MRGFVKDEWKRRLANNERNKKAAIDWYKNGKTPSDIAAYLGEPETVVRNLYLKGVIKKNNAKNR